MIFGIAGGIGQGKTLAMVWYLLREHLQLNKTVYANFHLKGIPYKYLTFDDLMQMAEEGFDFRNAVIVIDEAHIWLDSRTAASKLNRLFTYFVLQTGKEDINLYYTTQDFGQVDIRLRQRTDFAIRVKRRGDVILANVIYLPEEHVVTMAIPGPAVYQFYDTREKVELSRKSKTN